MLTSTEQSGGRCRLCRTPVTDGADDALCSVCCGRLLLSEGPLGEQGERSGPPLPPGFELIAPLGRGGMGEVLLVFQESLGRYVALKQLSDVRQRDPRARDRFLREARAAAQLVHPGIVPILEIGDTADPLWYTMEYAAGGDLAQHLAKRGGALPWREALTLTLKIAEALDYAHRQGIAHRDLKPSNILLSTPESIKVADFGLAWFASSGRDLTVTGEVVGTFVYLPPERLTPGTREIDPRLGDLYSLGALLFHLLTGRPPFEGDSTAQILTAVLKQTAPPLPG